MFAETFGHSGGMSAEAPFDPEHFRDVILDRMEELDLNNYTIGMAGGPSSTKLTSIRKASDSPPRADTFRKLDVALRWKQGSARRVAAGGQPTPLPPPQDMQEVIAEVMGSNLTDGAREAVLRALEAEPPKHPGGGRGAVGA